MAFFQIISFGIVAFTGGLFTFFILTSGKADKLGKSFAIASSYAALWAIPLVFWHMAPDAVSALLLLQIGVAISLLIPAGFFSFATTFVESVTHTNYSKYRKIAYIIGIFFAALFVSDILGFSGFMVPSVSHKFWFSYWPDAGPMFKYSLVYFFGTFGVSFYLLWKLMRTSKDSIVSGQLKIVLIGTITAMLGGSTNYFLYYNIPIPPLGTILVPIYVISMFYAIARYELFNIKTVTAQVVTFIIWSFLFIRLFFADSIGAFITDAILLVMVIIFGMFLIKSVLNEVKRKEQLKVLTGELKNLTGHLQEKVDEQTKEIRQSYELEKKARVELEELGRTKDDFILDAQSSLVTPLATLEGELDKLQVMNLDKEAEVNVLKIRDSTERLENLVEEFVSISQLKIGKTALNISRVNIEGLAKDTLSELAGTAEGKKVSVSLRFSGRQEDNLLDIDEKKIREVLSHLIDNAIKYNHEDGTVLVKGEKTYHPIERDKVIYRLTIEDTGIGISSEELPKIMSQYFQRGKEAEKVYTTGKGLGLTVSRTIVEAHGGRIYAESRGKDKGSKFTIEIPA